LFADQDNTSALFEQGSRAPMSQMGHGLKRGPVRTLVALRQKSRLLNDCPSVLPWVPVERLAHSGHCRSDRRWAVSASSTKGRL
jgi:hypothetical protein